MEKEKWFDRDRTPARGPVHRGIPFLWWWGGEGGRGEKQRNASVHMKIVCEGGWAARGWHYPCKGVERSRWRNRGLLRSAAALQLSPAIRHAGCFKASSGGVAWSEEGWIRPSLISFEMDRLSIQISDNGSRKMRGRGNLKENSLLWNTLKKICIFHHSRSLESDTLPEEKKKGWEGGGRGGRGGRETVEIVPFTFFWRYSITLPGNTFLSNRFRSKRKCSSSSVSIRGQIIIRATLVIFFPSNSSSSSVKQILE